jgi:hypothetical protein
MRLWMFGLDVVGGNLNQSALVGTDGMKAEGHRAHILIRYSRRVLEIWWRSSTARAEE